MRLDAVKHCDFAWARCWLGESSFVAALWFAVASMLFAASTGFAAWGDLPDSYDYEQVFGLEGPGAKFKVTMLESNAAGNVFHPGEKPEFVFQIENPGDEPIRMQGKVEIIRYAQRGRAGDNWKPELRVLEKYEPLDVEVSVGAKGWTNVTIKPPTPETRGGYGLVLDLGGFGRQYVTSYVRTFKPELKDVQFPRQSLEHMPPEILAKLGVQAIRWGISYHPTDSRRYEQQWEEISEELRQFREHKVTVVAEVGAGTAPQPLGRGRPHLEADGTMKGGKQDLVWLPEYDDDYEQFVYRLACEFGWPKGPITGFMLWNEPWEGLSISGWGADMIRYRTLYKHMGDAVFRARKDAGVDVLVGGCDSSANTIDKLFCDGTDEFLPYLDFCSIHYQGLSAPVLYPQWNNRKHYKGRVLIWDTESWVANTDDRFAAVVAANRAAGYDRSMGTLSRIAVSTLSHRRVAKDKIRTEDGVKTIERLIESRPLAAAYGAVQHFIGERDFKEILFKNGLPWVFVFEGLDGNPDDGTVVVVGDLGALFQKGGVLYEGVKRLENVESQMILDAASQPFAMYDVYGNPMQTTGGRITVPLRDRGYFLRADPAVKGSFGKLLTAVRGAEIKGIEPLEIVAYDMTEPVENGAVMRLRLTSMRNHRFGGKLSVTLGDLNVDYPKSLKFKARERKWIEVEARGRRRTDNAYPLKVRFDADGRGAVVHEEMMHVNQISHKRIVVDGKLDDWAGAFPQTIRTEKAAKLSFEESMWLPFEKLDADKAGGLAVGYLAYDDEHFYFAAKITDDTPDAGTVRFETRDEDADFYPKVSYESKNGKRVEHVWPEGVRRFSYRRWPVAPSSMPQTSFDNVLIGFNAIAMEDDGWQTHLAGRMPKFIWYKSTDYEYALNKVAAEYGGGTEIWRVLAPGMPFKHFYPRQPKHPLEGAVENGKLEVRYSDGMRIVECALPWSDIPHVKKRLDAGQTVKFSFHVNHGGRGPDMELAMNRSAAEGISNAFHPNWSRSWPNEIEFGFEK